MKRRKNLPDIPPFLDQWGRPTYDNPFGHYRRNPALDHINEGPPPAPPLPTSLPRPIEPVTEADAQVAGWEVHERHFEPAAPLPPPTPIIPGPVTPDQILERLRAAKAQVAADAATKPGPMVASPPPAPAPVAAAPPPPPVVAGPIPAAVKVEPIPMAPEVDEPARVDVAPALPDIEVVPAPRSRAERLARELASKRVRNRRRARRAGSVAAAGAAVFGVTAAYGFWTGGADAGSRVAKVTMLPIAAEATAGMANSPLLPRGRGNVKLRVTNPNAFAVTLTGVSGGPFPSAVDGAPGCTIANSGVTFIPPHSLNVSIPAKSTALVRLAYAAQMGPGSAPECRGHTFTIPVSVTVSKFKG